jgi:hypothetical protein
VRDERVVGQARRRDLVTGRVELVDEVHGLLVPARGEPHDARAPAERVDLRVVLPAELEALAVLAIGDHSPWRLPRQVALVRRDGEVGCPLLELHGVGAGVGCGADQRLCEVEVAVVIDADLGDDERLEPGTDLAAADRYRRHDLTLCSRAGGGPIQ